MEQSKVLELEQLNIERIANVRKIIDSNRAKGTIPTENDFSDSTLVMPEIQKGI